ncbi:hypothetical protein B566_EDAN006715 [Ephemera danica]|nr:hypothetical protein B566_EDAN006715 [Ephemera danica]
MSENLGSLEHLLEKHIPPKELSEVKRILYGGELRTLEIPQAAKNISIQHQFDIQGFELTSKKQDLQQRSLE